MTTPATTARSTEEQDLLQRSTKKSKRGRDSTVKNPRMATDEVIQETPLSAGLMSLESAHWRTPVETPNQAWRKRLSGHGGLAGNRPPKKPENDYKGNFGSWMLVSKRDRRYQMRGGNQSSARQQGPVRHQGETMNKSARRFETSSRYAILEGLEENEESVPQELACTPPINQVMNTNLPWIRTNQHTKKTTEQPRSKESASRVSFVQEQARYTHSPNRGGTRGRGGRSWVPKQAAAEAEHTVVRGLNRGKQITSTAVHHVYDQPESSHMEDIEYQFKEDPPPDAERIFTNPSEPPDENMADANRVNGQFGHEAASSQRI
nr:uncharacterized protein LOC109179535 isoform X2 [Ipomoea batatas]